MNQDQNYILGVFKELCAFTDETEWAEFKVNNYKPEAIGEYISALANSAALNGKVNAYIVWGC